MMIRKYDTEETFYIFYIIHYKSSYFKYHIQPIRTIRRKCLVTYVQFQNYIDKYFKYFPSDTVHFNFKNYDFC